MPRMNEGRPTLLTPEVHATIVKLLALGNYLETAAALAGVSRSTVFAWLRRGAEESDGIYFDFLVAARTAAAQSEATDLAIIQMAARRGDWKAAAWRLQHRFPSRWGRTQDGDGALEVEAVDAEVTEEAMGAAPLYVDGELVQSHELGEVARQILRERRAQRSREVLEH